MFVYKIYLNLQYFQIILREWEITFKTRDVEVFENFLIKKINPYSLRYSKSDHFNFLNSIFGKKLHLISACSHFDEKRDFYVYIFPCNTFPNHTRSFLIILNVSFQKSK